MKAFFIMKWIAIVARSTMPAIRLKVARSVNCFLIVSSVVWNERNEK